VLCEKQNFYKQFANSFIVTGYAEEVKLSTYRKGLCSDPCIVGRLGGLLRFPNLNNDMMG
jgi:hypothetical protein